MSYSDLPLDVHNDIYSFLENKHLNPILTTSRETHKIAHRYLQPQINDNEAIRTAVKDNNILAVRSLLQDPRVDPSADNNYAIRMASMSGYTEVVELLLRDSRVDPSVNDNDPIRKASKYGYVGWLNSFSKIPG